MAMNPLPPQAYTKDTLVKAYQWLQSQTENIKEIATSPEVLVSLYLKAKLQGDGALERPSIQNFKNELKNLAGMMGEFEVMDSPQAITPPQPPPPAKPIANLTAQSLSAPIESPPSQTPLAKSLPLQHSELDTRSWLMIQEVKNQMNLSNETEALRLLISVGHQKLKSLMDKA